mmetsp:Transcript_23161/g.32376  ORF Transcript_23161/g.32376 Transcript_23161/m.32376 type:complete len:89 (+) Transcript_23161:799-1065(+)
MYPIEVMTQFECVLIRNVNINRLNKCYHSSLPRQLQSQYVFFTKGTYLDICPPSACRKDFSTYPQFTIRIFNLLYLDELCGCTTNCAL